MFQFTHPGGVRLELCHLDHLAQEVSIHAPGRGATYLSDHLSAFARGFNSRTREGCDIARWQTATMTSWFQFTHPGGVRLYPDAQP